MQHATRAEQELSELSKSNTKQVKEKQREIENLREELVTVKTKLEKKKGDEALAESESDRMQAEQTSRVREISAQLSAAEEAATLAMREKVCS